MHYFDIDIAHELVVLVVLSPTRRTLLESDSGATVSIDRTYAIEYCLACCTSFQHLCRWKAPRTRATDIMVERCRMVFTEFADRPVVERHRLLAWSGFSQASQAQ